FFFFQAEDGIRDYKVTGVQTCALPIYRRQFAVLGCQLLALTVCRLRQKPHQPTRNSLTQLSIVSRNSRRRPSKKWPAPSIKTSFFGSAKESTNCLSFTRGPN